MAPTVLRLLLAALLFVLARPGAAHETADSPSATYLANAGVMIARGATRIVFDPLYRNDFGTYERVPDDMERALLDAKAPFDDIDAVFVSHYHGDHFSPEPMLAFLDARPESQLFAPGQAVAALRDAGASATQLARVTEVNLAYRDEPVSFSRDGLYVEAVLVPHSGWPERMTDVENIAWRVTLDEHVTVVHLGDADTKPAHFEQHADYWQKSSTDLALPPYWYFLSPNGRRVLETYIRPLHAIGVHVPASMPDTRGDRPAEIVPYDLFTVPGEVRDLSVSAGERAE